jgi:transcription elongation factor GreA
MEYYLSQERYDELQKELETLKTAARREIAEDLKRAKEYGDLSENAEYAEARLKQSAIEARIFELEELLREAKIIKKNGNSEEVTIGSEVTVKKDGKTITYTIVGSDESRPEENRISNESPLGRAFLGKKIGDHTEVETPVGVMSYQIVKIA